MSILGSNPRAPVDAQHPEAQAICDRCGFLWPHRELRWQYQWQGAQLINQNFLVCPDCIDIPQEQLRTIIIPPDPIPVQDARPARWASQIGTSPDSGPPTPVVPGVPDD